MSKLPELSPKNTRSLSPKKSTRSLSPKKNTRSLSPKKNTRSLSPKKSRSPFKPLSPKKVEALYSQASPIKSRRSSPKKSTRYSSPKNIIFNQAIPLMIDDFLKNISWKSKKYNILHNIYRKIKELQVTGVPVVDGRRIQLDNIKSDLNGLRSIAESREKFGLTDSNHMTQFMKIYHSLMNEIKHILDKNDPRLTKYNTLVPKAHRVSPIRKTLSSKSRKTRSSKSRKPRSSKSCKPGHFRNTLTEKQHKCMSYTNNNANTYAKVYRYITTGQLPAGNKVYQARFKQYADELKDDDIEREAVMHLFNSNDNLLENIEKHHAQVLKHKRTKAQAKAIQRAPQPCPVYYRKKDNGRCVQFTPQLRKELSSKGISLQDAFYNFR